MKAATESCWNEVTARIREERQLKGYYRQSQETSGYYLSNTEDRLDL